MPGNLAEGPKKGREILGGYGGAYTLTIILFIYLFTKIRPINFVSDVPGEGK